MKTMVERQLKDYRTTKDRYVLECCEKALKDDPELTLLVYFRYLQGDERYKRSITEITVSMATQGYMYSEVTYFRKQAKAIEKIAAYMEEHPKAS